jgi:hypothetical protein
MSSIGQTFSQSGHADLTEENDTFTHRISHADLASGEWPRHNLSPISHADLTRSEKDSRCSRDKLGVMQNVSLAEREC